MIQCLQPNRCHMNEPTGLLSEKERPRQRSSFEGPSPFAQVGLVHGKPDLPVQVPSPARSLPGNILITGATGYIGAAMVSHLLDVLTGAKVVAMVSNDEQAVVLRNLIEPAVRSRLTFRIGRLPHQIPDLSGIDSVVHLAGIRKVNSGRPKNGENAHGASGSSEPDVLSVNHEGTRGLIAAARAAKIRHFIFISSQSVYGTQMPVPWDESQAPCPQGVYASSKYASELLLRDVQDISSTIFRVPRVYGVSACNGIRGLEWNEVPNVLIAGAVHGKELKIKGDGRQSYDFLHLRDLCTAVERALLLPPSGCRVLNLSSSMPITMKELAELCCEIAASLGVQTPPIAYESQENIPASFGLNSTLARRELEWHAEVTMHAGIDELMRRILSETGV